MINKVTWNRVHRLWRFVWAQRSPPSFPTTNSENKERIRIHFIVKPVEFDYFSRDFAAGCLLGAAYFAATTVAGWQLGFPSTRSLLLLSFSFSPDNNTRPFVYNFSLLEESTLRRALTTIARLTDTGRVFSLRHCVNILKQNIYLPPTWRTTTGLRRSERVRRICMSLRNCLRFVPSRLNQTLGN